jgi:hypothetical protein
VLERKIVIAGRVGAELRVVKKRGEVDRRALRKYINDRYANE